MRVLCQLGHWVRHHPNPFCQIGLGEFVPWAGRSADVPSVGHPAPIVSVCFIGKAQTYAHLPSPLRG